MSREEIYVRLNEVFRDVFDRDDITVSDETTRWYYGTKNTSSWRGDVDESHGYHFIGIVDGEEVDLIVSYGGYGQQGSYYDPYITYRSGTWMGQPQYTQYPDDAPIYVESKKTRMTAEQEALSNLFDQLMDLNNAEGESDDDMVEVSVIRTGVSPTSCHSPSLIE